VKIGFYFICLKYLQIPDLILRTLVVSSNDSPNTVVATGDRVRVEIDSENSMTKFLNEWERRYNYILHPSWKCRISSHDRGSGNFALEKVCGNSCEYSSQGLLSLLSLEIIILPVLFVALKSLRNSDKFYLADTAIHSDPKDEVKGSIVEAIPQKFFRGRSTQVSNFVRNWDL
jgi:hypothetical protein